MHNKILISILARRPRVCHTAPDEGPPGPVGDGVVKQLPCYSALNITNLSPLLIYRSCSFVSSLINGSAGPTTLSQVLSSHKLFDYRRFPMTVQIATNTPANKASYYLAQNQKRLSRTLDRLSSGKRLTSLFKIREALR